MQIVVVATTQIEAEFRQKFSGAHKYLFVYDYNQIRSSLRETDVVFDFLLQESPERIKLYQEREGLIVFCHAVNFSLTQLMQQVKGTLSCRLFGFNGWPTMINRPSLEISLLHEQDKDALDAVCKALGTAYLLVDDRVGMVTPRVLSMIINEAYYTWQEQIAVEADIDLALKLGTNYPLGPFEWAKKIGVRNVYQLLEAVYTDTKDERYKICPLLKKQYLYEELQK